MKKIIAFLLVAVLMLSVCAVPNETIQAKNRSGAYRGLGFKTTKKAKKWMKKYKIKYNKTGVILDAYVKKNKIFIRGSLTRLCGKYRRPRKVKYTTRAFKLTKKTKYYASMKKMNKTKFSEKLQKWVKKGKYCLELEIKNDKVKAMSVGSCG